MVRTSIGLMEWGFTSFSDGQDNDFNLWFNEEVPAIETAPDGTLRLKLGLRLDQGTPREVWEIGHYGPEGFQKAMAAPQQYGADEEKYRPLMEQDLQAPAAIRCALHQFAVELGCPVWYRLNRLHLRVCLQSPELFKLAV